MAEIIVDYSKMIKTEKLTKEFYNFMINQFNKKEGYPILSGCTCTICKSKYWAPPVHSRSENGREEEPKMTYLLIELTVEPTKYYICPSCAELITSDKLNEQIENTGQSECLCEFYDNQWSEKGQYFEPNYFRIYNDYKEIPQEIYDVLVKVKNDVERLKMYRSWAEKFSRKV